LPVGRPPRLHRGGNRTGGGGDPKRGAAVPPVPVDIEGEHLELSLEQLPEDACEREEGVVPGSVNHQHPAPHLPRWHQPVRHHLAFCGRTPVAPPFPSDLTRFAPVAEGSLEPQLAQRWRASRLASIAARASSATTTSSSVSPGTRSGGARCGPSSPVMRRAPRCQLRYDQAHCRSTSTRLRKPIRKTIWTK